MAVTHKLMNGLCPLDLWDENGSLTEEENVKHDDYFTNSDLFHTGEVVGADPLFQASDMDINTDLEHISTLYLKKSPWHESDSGMSTMSETGSPSWNTDLQQTNELALALDVPVVDWPEAESDLAAYLLGADLPINEDEQEDNATFNPPEQNISMVQPQSENNYNTRSKSNVSSMSGGVEEVDLDIENCDSHSECSTEGNASPNSNKSTASHPLNFYHDMVNPPTRSKPAVKVVKVLKTSGASDCCDEDIMKALDERSKKNAIQAKMNREKKKKYVSSLENDLEKLKEENSGLRETNAELNKEVGSLEEEVRYLKSVLVNASALSGLLKNIGEVGEVKLSASIVGRKRGASSMREDDDHSYTATLQGTSTKGHVGRSAKRARMVKENLDRAGVCLHVNGSDASLEFCAHCSSLSRNSQASPRKS